ncbi:MAG: transposase family protein, partial [Dolichospermum sp.]
MTLFQHLDTIQDPRYKRGIRHPLPALLKAILLGFLVGQTTIENIAFYSILNNFRLFFKEVLNGFEEG